MGEPVVVTRQSIEAVFRCAAATWSGLRHRRAGRIAFAMQTGLPLARSGTPYNRSGTPCNYRRAGSGRILMLRYSMRAVWSCRQRWPLAGGSWKCCMFLNLLLATRCFQSAPPSSYSTIFSPFSQCSMWLPSATTRTAFHWPRGCDVSFAGAYRS